MWAPGVLRMGDETSLTLTNVSDNTVQVELHQGTLYLHAPPFVWRGNLRD